MTRGGVARWTGKREGGEMVRGTRLVALAFVLSAAFLVSSCDDTGHSKHAGRLPAHIKVDLKKLVASTTQATIRRAPRDSAPQGTTQGDVVHPHRTIAVFAKPAAKPFAKITPKQLGDTWLPVVD